MARKQAQPCAMAASDRFRPGEVISPGISTMTAPSPSHAGVVPGNLPAVPVPALYVHVPFCFHKCHYCDFYSITRQSPARMQRFVDLILAEADMWVTRSKGPTTLPTTL